MRDDLVVAWAFCPDCRGIGLRDPDKSPCLSCGGEGQVRKLIPKGVNDENVALLRAIFGDAGEEPDGDSDSGAAT